MMAECGTREKGERLRIALLSYEFPPETGFGGIGTYTWYQARALARLGAEVHVLAGATAPTSLREEQVDGAQVFRFRSDGRWMKVFGLLARRRLWWSANRLQNALSMARGLRRLAARHRYDVVEMPECGAEGLFINPLRRAATVVKLHSPAQLIMGCYEVRRADHVVCSAIERLALVGAGKLVAASHFLAQEAADKLRLRRPIEVIPNGIDLDLFDSAPAVDMRRRLDIPRDRIVILFTGRMEPRKGIHLVKEIVPRLLEVEEVEILLAGEDLFGHVARELVPSLQGRSLRGRLHVLGRLGLADVRACLLASDIFFMPSLWENCPYSCLEAMAAKRAMVVSDAGGLPELIRDGREGLVVGRDDVGGYGAALRCLIADRDLRQRLGAAARRRVEADFSDRRVAEQSLLVYRGLLEGSRHPSIGAADREAGR